MKKFTKQLLTGVIALGLLAPVATSAISNNPQINVNAKRRHHRHYYHHYARHKRLPARFNGYWRGRRHHFTMRAHFSRKGVYMIAPHIHGYINPHYWTSGFYGGYNYQFGIINHGRTLVVNTAARNGQEEAWYLHRI